MSLAKKVWKCVNCHFSSQYSSDVLTSRVRLNKNDMKLLGFTVGSILHLKLLLKFETDENSLIHEKNKSCELLCVIWPDNTGSIESGLMIADDTVFVGTVPDFWFECECQILKYYPYSVSSSVQVSQYNNTSFSYFGLPAMPGCAIKIDPSRNRNEITFFGRNQPMVSVINPLTQITQIKTDSNAPVLPFTNTKLIDELYNRIIDPLLQTSLNLQMQGFLLCGPPGGGKTVSVKALQTKCKEKCKINVFELNIPDILSSNDTQNFFDSVVLSSQNYSNLRRQNLEKKAGSSTPEVFIVLIDEIDALGKDGSQSNIQIGVISFISKFLDNLYENSTFLQNIVVVATTNRPDKVDQRLRRGGRLTSEIDVFNDRNDRLLLLKSGLQQSFNVKSININIENLENIIDQISEKIVDRLGGYMAADISFLIDESQQMIVNRLKMDVNIDFEKYLQECLYQVMKIMPASLRGISIHVTNLNINDVIGCVEAKQALRRILSFADPAKYKKIKAFNLEFPGGVLLHGPPGNSKTRLIATMASVYGLPTINLTAADIYSPYFGDSEAVIRKVFSQARQFGPCILFFDEIDAIVSNRSTTGSASAESRVLASFLTEMDGLSEQRDGVFVFATTNCLQNIDSALLRKGRFHHIVYIPNPSMSERIQLVEYFSTQFGLDQIVVEELIEKVSHVELEISGADIENLCREQSMILLKNKISSLI